MQRNLIAFHESIAGEFEITKDRVRDLIGSTHWQSDGQHKEAIVRRMLRSHIADSYRVGTGFVAYPEFDNPEQNDDRDTSRQIDVLITKSSRPTLFRDGEFVIVTPDAVCAVIEVKTSRDATQIAEDLVKLVEEKDRLHRSSNTQCKVGLFVFDDSPATDESVLSALCHAANGSISKTVGWIALGQDRFFRFWSNAHQEVRGQIQGPAWHSYKIERLAPAYFLSNTVVELDGTLTYDIQKMWFPIVGAKEIHREYYIGLNGPCRPERF